MTDLTKLTQQELLQLKFAVQNELDNFEKRDKLKVYFIFQPFEGRTYFKTHKDMIKALFSLYEDWDLFDGMVDKIEFGVCYLSEAEYNSYTS